MVKAVIFDLDGTLLNTLPDLNACMNEALVKFGCPTITTEQTRQYVGHGGLRYAQAALPENKRAQAEYFYKTIYCPILFACTNQLTKPFDGESECMDALRAAGIKHAVVTNKSQEAATELGNTLLAPYGFDVIFGQSGRHSRQARPRVHAHGLKGAGRIRAGSGVCGGRRHGRADGAQRGNALRQRAVGVPFARTADRGGRKPLCGKFSALRDILLSM